MYENLTMEQRVDRVGELLAKAVYLFVRDQEKQEEECHEEKAAVNDNR